MEIKSKLFIGSIFLILILLIFPFISSATLGLTANYTFADKTNNKAYNYTTGAVMDRWVNNASVIELPATGYTALLTRGAASGNATVTPIGTNDYVLMKFVFNLNQSAISIKSINITIFGGENGQGNGALNTFNWTSNAWVPWAANLSTTYGGTTFNLSGTGGINNAKYFVGNTNNLTILLDSPDLTIDSGAFHRVDYISVNVTYDDNNPQWFTNTTNGTDVGTYVLHSVNLTDQIGLSGYIFEFNNGTSYANDTFVVANGVQNWANVSKWINTTEGASISWRVYINDSLNQVNSTTEFNYTTTSPSANCWTYDSVGKMLIIPTGCIYSLSSGGMQGI